MSNNQATHTTPPVGKDSTTTPQARYSVEFQGVCLACTRKVDVLSRRVIDGAHKREERGEPGLVYSRHLRGEQGMCMGSLSDYVRAASSNVGGDARGGQARAHVGGGAHSRKRANSK